MRTFASDRPSDLAPLLRSYCVDCHNADLTEGELDLTALLEGELPAEQRGRLLEKMYERVAAGEMPPEDAGYLAADERSALADVIVGSLERLQAESRDDPGRVVMPRLTPREYRNVIRDLSGGVVTDAGKYLPNEGGAGEGFANVGEAQSMTTAQFEKYLEAAKGALAYLRVYPRTRPGEVDVLWRTYPRDPVPGPAEARKELTDDIIAWHVAQQQKWNEEHREDLNNRLGFAHAAYLEAAWRYHWRGELGKPDASFAEFAECDGVALAPVVLEKWYAILSAEKPQSPFVEWAEAWQALPPPAQIDAEAVRAECIEVEQGESAAAENAADDYAPAYEISFHEAQEEVIAAADQGRWPFRIEIGEADELFLVATDAGDGNRGEYAVWQRGWIYFEDGTSQPWEKVVTVRGANSGREFPWGVDGEGAARLPPDSIGVRPPGALKFAVPQGARTFEVELAIDENRTSEASIQALVLKEKPNSQSYVPGRYVFGGKKRDVSSDDISKELARALRKRNVAEANLTKIGLNAERNVFVDWNRTRIENIGGPWPDQVADKEEPLYPYHLTVHQVRANATRQDLAELAALQDRLHAIAQPTQQAVMALLKRSGLQQVREGVLPDADQTRDLPAAEREQVVELREQIAAEETVLASQARSVVESLARRAWRRPLSDTELDWLMTLYDESRMRGFSFDESVKSSLLAILASPHFLYRHPHVGPVGKSESTAVVEQVRLESYELASRLSFFLWASIPDDELLRLAAENSLRDPEVLRVQARRMLKDPRARSLARDFGGQLWSFADFEAFDQPDEKRFTEFTTDLRSAMLEEVVAMLSDVFRNDRPLIDLLDADYTFVNSELARHYELEDAFRRAEANRAASGAEADVHDSGFHRVQLPTESPRGGLVGMGLFLTQTSLPLRTSPVQRGVWVMEQMLGRDLPNPPADVPSLSEDDTNAAGESIREQLEKHRALKSCASCHDKIDPLGIALENFDAIGRFRKAERDGTALSTTATSHDGVELDGAEGLKQYLIDHQDEFIQHFNRKLLGYALGRAVQPGDAALLERMHAAGRFSAVIEEVVTSPQFTTRRSPEPLATSH